MKWFKNRNTTTKLLITFGSMAILAAVVGYQGIHGMGVIHELATVNYEKHALGLDHIQEAHVQVVEMSRSAYTAILEEQKALEMRVAGFKVQLGAFNKEMEGFKKTIVAPELKAIAAEIEKLVEQLRRVQERAMELAKLDKAPDAYALLAGARPTAALLEEQIKKAADFKREFMRKAVEDADAVFSRSRLFVVALIAGAVALAIGVGLFVAGLIARPLGQAGEVLEGVAEGDFTRKLELDTTDEIGRMAAALNRAVDGMRAALQEVSNSANSAASASVQLSAASEQLSSGAQEQASSLEETAASLEEITGTVKQNADNARQASQLAMGSRDVAEKGGQVVAEAIRSMKEINQSSKKIADIITTIDEIAFQTNLLALNAAVEAARAGEQGRGFAVVASEVRNLAQRSATAAKEIKGLIQDSVAKVEAGSELVNRSGETLTEIVGSVKRVTDIIAEIAAASQEQTTGIDQVNTAVTQLDQVTQSNAAQTEQLSSTAQALAGQAAELQAMVGRFKLGDGQAGGTRPVPASGRGASRPSAAARPVARGRRAVDAGRGPVRKTDEVLMPAVPVGSNGKGHKDDGFEEF